MPRRKKPLATIRVELLTAGTPTKGGRIYPRDLLEGMMAAINEKPVTIEELSPVERKAKGVPLCYSWPEHAMATSTVAEMAGDDLVVTFDVPNNKYGKLLLSTFDSAGGQDKVRFVPVGIGDSDESGTVTNYQLQYVSIKVHDA